MAECSIPPPGRMLDRRDGYNPASRPARCLRSVASGLPRANGRHRQASLEERVRCPRTKPTIARHGEPEPQVADAGLLFQDASAPPASSVEPSRQQPRVRLGRSVRPGRRSRMGQRLGACAVSIAAARAPAGACAGRAAQPSATTARAARDSRLDPSALVEETWSRWAEWGTNLIVVGAWADRAAAPGLFRLRPGILRAGVCSAHRRGCWSPSCSAIRC